MVVPEHMVAGAALAVTFGKEFTVTVTDVVLVHPFTSVPVMVYVVVFAGLAVTLEPEPDDNPVVGAQV